MKKKLVLLITLVVSIFICSDRVMAKQVMSVACSEDFIMAMGTEKVGTVKLKIGVYAYRGKVWKEHFFADLDDCWIIDSANANDNCSIGENGKESKNFNINDAMCPEMWRQARDLTTDVVIVGDLSLAPASSTLESSEYVFYQDNDSKTIYAESYYVGNGAYSHINNKKFDGIDYQNEIIRFGDDVSDWNINFWKVAQNFKETSYACVIDEDCEEHYTILFDSNNNKSKLTKKVDDWFEDEGGIDSNSDQYSKFIKIINDEKFISVVDKMNKEYEEKGRYDFNDGYTAQQMLDKLSEAYDSIKYIYNNPKLYTNYSNTNKKTSDPLLSAFQYTMLKTLNYPSISGYCSSNDDFECLNVTYLNRIIYDDIEDYLKGKGNFKGKYTILDLGKDNFLDEYLTRFLTAIVYMNKYSDLTDLSDSIKENDLPSLRDDISSFAKERNIFVAIDCEDLISDKLKEKIEKYYNFFKIAISLILIGYGILDFSKAIFANDEKNMKEAQTKFIKRIVVVIVLFLVPLFVKFLLTLANSAWSNIYPGACGLF